MKTVFTNQDRELLYGILNGTYSDGVPVPGVPQKIHALLAERGINLDNRLISQRLHWFTNDQELWRCAHHIASKERPGIFEENQARAAIELSGIPESRINQLKKLRAQKQAA